MKFYDDVVYESLSLKIESAQIQLILKKEDQFIPLTFLIMEEADTFLMYSPVDLKNIVKTIHFENENEALLRSKFNSNEIKFTKSDEAYCFIQTDGKFFNSQETFSWGLEDAPVHIISFSMFTCFNAISDIQTVTDNHKKFWQKFWRTNISIPDKFLETLWYLYLYLIKASNGKDSIHFEQATGLNGLWDTKNNSLWGSMWYWDVNIQSTFWSVFSANHLELAKQFCEGYLGHEKNILKYTKEYYGSDEWAIDYPHHFYNCIQPWCAQFLFWYYEYSNDENFLKEVLAVFESQCQFILENFDVNQKKIFFPDLAPEQGPLAADSTITIATVKYLFEFTIRSLKILGREIPSTYTEFLNKLPEYSLTGGQQKRLKDTPYSKDDLWLRHPSVLMPIFPIREKAFVKGGEHEDIAKNTVRFATENCEIGMFGPMWIAAAHAELGQGDEALRTIYEKGFDHFIHANGLPYEETERWTNLALITKPPIYLPAMMEPTGGFTNALNEMLIQSSKGVIKLFPALPRGVNEVKQNSYPSDQVDIHSSVQEWSDVTIENLLVKGGHQVSATITSNRLSWLKVIPGKTESVALVLPDFLVNEQGVPANLTLKKGVIVEFGTMNPKKEVISYPLVQDSVTFRKIFLGKNKNTEYYKKMDNMTRPYVLGNSMQFPMTVYKFDFGGTKNKDYTDVFHRQVNFSAPVRLLSTGYRIVDEKNDYSKEEHFGFVDNSAIMRIQNNVTDTLRSDGLISSKCNTFAIDMPAGSYTLLIGVGGGVSSITHITIGNYQVEKKLAANEYEYLEIPILHNGGRCFIKFSSTQRWAVNFMVMNKQRSFY